MVELLFDTFNVPNLYIANQAILSMYANGRVTGISIDLGDGVTQAVPVFEGHLIPHAAKKNFIAGRAITNYMTQLLIGAGHLPQANTS